VGGGPGAYAVRLARLGYAVHLVDALPLHVDQAWRAAGEQGAALAGYRVGDARRLDFPGQTADGVLLLEPLYHLTARADRLQALAEARRVLRAGGVVCAAGISCFASSLDGLFRGYLRDPQFAAIVARDLQDGQHRNPANHPAYFTTAFFHHPEELAQEVAEAGFSLEGLFGIEGPGWLLPDLASFWNDEQAAQVLLAALRALETEPSLLGLSAHLLAVGRSP